MGDLSGLLGRARQQLPEGIAVSPEQILIGGTPRRELKTALNQSGGAASAAQLSFETTVLTLEAASRAYLKVTPAAEYIDRTADGPDVPSADELAKLMPGVDEEQAGINGLFTDYNGTLEAREKLEEATKAHKEARERHGVTQAQVALSERTRKEMRRLSRVPQAVLAVVTTALIGGAGYQAEQATHNQARAITIIASKTVQPATKRYRALEGSANNTQNDTLEAFSLLGAISIGAGAWWVVGDRPARPRVWLIIRNAKRKARSLDLPEE
ncbi:MAG TPA: hypothetical protein VGG13_00445 [Candidatus Saccharimonadales bacterium]|jgi:hypothetical protein